MHDGLLIPRHYRPNFTLTLIRPHPDAPPRFASFITPLNLNKLDLKDYLYNAYGVHVLSVRSYVQQQRVREGKPGSKWPQRNRYVWGDFCLLEGWREDVGEICTTTKW